MAGRVKKNTVPRKKANGYKMPASIATGEIIHNTIAKKKWRIGPSIGIGGFGEIYSACDYTGSPKKNSSYPYVVKIEPHENGPLFVEKHFYVRNASEEDISKYKKEKKITSLGMPTYFGNGSHDYKGEKYRYLVLERYGKDIWSLFKECKRSFPPTTVFLLGLQMLDVLEYIHSRGYVHADIKGANILLGLKKGTENQAYLVDFGLATRVNDKDFKPDPKCAHNGTIEYTSRDAHQGVPTMRGDLEILAYNMLQWLVGELPWEKSLKQPKAVQDMKESFMKNIRSNITKQYSDVPNPLIKFFEYINTMKPKDIPDYTKCKQILESYLKSVGKNKNSKLEFTPNKKQKANVSIDSDNDDSGDAEVKPRQNGAKNVVRRGKKAKMSDNTGNDNSNNDEPNVSVDGKNEDSENIKVKPRQNVAKRGRKAKITDNTENDDSDNEEPNNPEVTNSKVKRGRKPKPVEDNVESDDCENQEPDSTVEIKSVKARTKRKSSEPSYTVKVKKIRVASKATPPVKKNHANIATQTSIEKRKRDPRQVSFDSPISKVIGDKKPLTADNDSVNSSGDIFEDSYIIEDRKVKPKKRLLSDEEEVVTRVIRKKVTTVKTAKKGKVGKSWKDLPSVVNGRSPPK